MYLEDKGDLTFLAHTYLNHKKKLKKNRSHKFWNWEKIIHPPYEKIRRKKRACITLNIQGPHLMDGAINNTGHKS